MKKFSLMFLSVLLLGMSLSHSALAKKNKSDATTPFDTLKTLEGTWKAQVEMNGKKEDARLVYKVTSGGNALEETIFAGSPKEMVSIYFKDNDRVLMTHYCMMGNQPRLKVTEVVRNKIKFEQLDATGMKTPQDSHMGGLTVTFKDKDHFQQEWVHFNADGSEDSSVFAWEREK